MTHRRNLDLLRTFAVSAVIADHFALTVHTHLGLMQEGHRHFVTALGQAGVLAFFVHTSLVLMYSLERMHAKSEKVTLPFYLRRTFRIYPLAFAAVLIVVLFHIPYKTWDTAEPVGHAVIVANLLLVQNLWTKQQVLSPLWSLPYEVQMYVVLPFLFLVAMLRKGALYIALLIGVFALLGVAIAMRTNHLNMAAYVPCFLSGVLCYSLRRRITPVLPAWSWPVFLLAIMGVFVATSSGEEPVYWAGWIFCLILGLGINLFRDAESGAFSYVSARVALYSYGIYLLHVPALYLVFVVAGLRSLWWGTLFFACLTWIFAVVAFHILESPMVELGRRLSGENVTEAKLFEPAPEVSRL